MKKFGAPDQLIQARTALEEDRDFSVLQVNFPIVEFFYLCRTQWRMTIAGAAGMGGAVLRPIMVGLDYASVAVLAKALRFNLAGDNMRRLQLMEAAALAEFARAA